ncbi:MAG: DUF2130 domain-containing protein [Spirochaetales bacterium]|nr:DUF2130 domain-containing protein [Candidatus Physcosoma equi]
MSEIKCPNCGEVFTVDEAGYAQIVKQVRDSEFQKELQGFRQQLEKEKESTLRLSLVETEQKYLEKLRAKEEELQKVQGEKALLDSNHESSLALLTERHKAELERVKTDYEKKLSEENAKAKDSVQDKDALIEDLKRKLASFSDEEARALEKNNYENERKLSLLKEELASLKERLQNSENEKKLALNERHMEYMESLSRKDLEIQSVKSQAENDKAASLVVLGNMKEKYEGELKRKDDLIAYYKDFKTKLSTKMVGESLEVYCQNEFNKIRSVAFRNAYFEKDNDAATGSKGDFIYKEYAEDGTEYLSIMFEMKNENETTATKHKNEHFFKELDKDRREKGCEYAVLVSMLEAENDYYNSGIVEVYEYPKMFVIRPTFFIPLISILKNATAGSLEYKRELALEKQRNIDVTNFEERLNDFKDGFSRNYQLASKKFKDAIDEIDKSISHLQKVREGLVSSENNLRLANNKAEDLSIKKLTRNNLTMTQLFQEARENQ